MRKRVLFITHQLSKTGAPIVLLDMIQFCRDRNYEVVVISMEEGELREILEEMQIPVIIRKQFLPDYEVFLQQAELFDIVVANTLITFEAVHVLRYAKVPVIWWLHEGRQYFEYFSEVLLDFRKLPEHIRVFAVSPYVRQAVWELYHDKLPLLPIGVEDVFTPKEKEKRSKVRFVVSGTYSKIKGQDILAEAVQRLPAEYISRLQIEFYGNLEMRDEEVFQKVERLSEAYEDITIMPFVSHEEMLGKIAEADCMIIPSRIDPLPTVAVEAMMEYVPCICSDVCGIAGYIEDGRSGILFRSEDAAALAEKICYVLDHRDLLTKLGKAGRNIYETYYSKEVFYRNLEQLL